jgi:magnesium transporter
MLRSFSCHAGLLVERSEPPAALDPDLVWIDLLNPSIDEQRVVEALLELSIPTQEEMLEIELSARLYQEDGAEFMTMTAIANLDGEEPVKTPVSFILKHRVLVTVRWSDPRPIIAYQSRAARQKDVLSGNGEQVMVGLLEAFTDRTADALEKVGNEIDQLSRGVFLSKPRKVAKMTHDLQLVIQQLGRKAELLTMVQESLVSVGRVTAYHAALEVSPRKGAISRETRSMLKVVQRDALALGEHARSLIGRVNFLLDATLGLINLEQNQIIKIFSVAAVVFLPPTLVASIYGMNFDFMPELHWPLGYPFALGLMVLSAVVPYLFFKRKGWL